MKSYLRNLLIIFPLLFIFAGCQSSSKGSKTYTRSQAQSPITVFSGTVLKIAEVQIQNKQTGAGAAVGGIAGGVIGNQVGSGGGRAIATVLGALAGSAAGSTAERSAATKPALELEVELDNGRILVIVQEKDDDFAVGDRVRIMESGDGTMRVRQ